MSGWTDIVATLDIQLPNKKRTSPTKMMELTRNFSSIDTSQLESKFSFSEVLALIKNDIANGAFTLNRKQLAYILISFQKFTNEVEQLNEYVIDSLKGKELISEKLAPLILKYDTPPMLRQFFVATTQFCKNSKFVVKYVDLIRNSPALSKELAKRLAENFTEPLQAIKEAEDHLSVYLLNRTIGSLLSFYSLDQITLISTTDVILLIKHLCETYGHSHIGNDLIQIIKTPSTLVPRQKNWVEELLALLIDKPEYKDKQVLHFQHIFKQDKLTEPNEKWIRKFLDWEYVKKNILRDNERGKFWGKYWDQISEYEIHADSFNQIIAMKIGNFWIVEKSDIGAAYFYEDIRYKEQIANGNHSFIDRDKNKRCKINHMSRWEDKMNSAIQKIQDNNSLQQLQSITDQYKF